MLCTINTHLQIDENILYNSATYETLNLLSTCKKKNKKKMSSPIPVKRKDRYTNRACFNIFHKINIKI